MQVVVLGNVIRKVKYDDITSEEIPHQSVAWIDVVLALSALCPSIFLNGWTSSLSCPELPLLSDLNRRTCLSYLSKTMRQNHKPTNSYFFAFRADCIAMRLNQLFKVSMSPERMVLRNDWHTNPSLLQTVKARIAVWGAVHKWRHHVEVGPTFVTVCDVGAGELLRNVT